MKIDADSIKHKIDQEYKLEIQNLLSEQRIDLEQKQE